jgi:hypothetical protein
VHCVCGVWLLLTLTVVTSSVGRVDLTRHWRERAKNPNQAPPLTPPPHSAVPSPFLTSPRSHYAQFAPWTSCGMGQPTVSASRASTAARRTVRLRTPRVAPMIYLTMMFHMHRAGSMHLRRFSSRTSRVVVVRTRTLPCSSQRGRSMVTERMGSRPAHACRSRDSTRARRQRSRRQRRA